MELLLSVAASHLVGFAAMRNFISGVQFHSSLSLSKSELPWSFLVFVQLSSRLVQGALQPRTKLAKTKKELLILDWFQGVDVVANESLFYTVSFQPNL